MFDRYLANVSSLKLEASLCAGCGMCVTVCPQQVWKIENKKARIVNLDACMECSACAVNCAEAAIQVRRGVGCVTAIIGSAINSNTNDCR